MSTPCFGGGRLFRLSVSGRSRSAAGPRPQRLDGFTTLGDLLATWAMPNYCGRGPAVLHQQLGEAPLGGKIAGFGLIFEEALDNVAPFKV
jgi:hypothetical protein